MDWTEIIKAVLVAMIPYFAYTIFSGLKKIGIMADAQKIEELLRIISLLILQAEENIPDKGRGETKKLCVVESLKSGKLLDRKSLNLLEKNFGSLDMAVEYSFHNNTKLYHNK